MTPPAGPSSSAEKPAEGAPRCPRCGYDFRGLEPVGNTFVCPECAMASRATTWTDSYAEIVKRQAERRAARRTGDASPPPPPAPPASP